MASGGRVSKQRLGKGVLLGTRPSCPDFGEQRGSGLSLSRPLPRRPPRGRHQPQNQAGVRASRAVAQRAFGPVSRLWPFRGGWEGPMGVGGGSLPRGSPQWLDRAGSLGKPNGGSRIKTDPERGLTRRKSLPLGWAAAPGSTTAASPAGTCPGPCLVGCEGWSLELGWELQLREPWGGCHVHHSWGRWPTARCRDGPVCQELGLGPAPRSPRSAPGAPGLGWLSCSGVLRSPRASRKQTAAPLRPPRLPRAWAVRPRTQGWPRPQVSLQQES